MRFEDMKKEIPETPEFIHQMIQDEVEKQMKNTRVIPMKREKRKGSGMKVAAAALACVLATSTVVYAGSRMYQMYLEKQGTYGVATGVKPEEEGKQQAIPEQIHGITFTPGYIPEGMDWTEEGKMSDMDHPQIGGFSFAEALLDQGSLDQVMKDQHVVEAEERTFGAYEGVYLRYQNLEGTRSFDQRIYLLCPDLYRVITIYIGDDVSKEDAVKVAENLKLTENDTLLATADLYTWSQQIAPEMNGNEEVVTSIAKDQLKIHPVGEPFAISASGEDGDGNSLNDLSVSVKVDAVQVADDLQLLDATQIPEDWEAILDSDGKLKANTLSYIRNGDGIDTLDEVVKTETVKQKLVYAAVTYTNNTEKEINHLLYMGSLMMVEEQDGTCRVDLSAEEGGDGYDRILSEYETAREEMPYSSVQDDYGNGGNYIPSLKPGESVQVQMAWIVNEPDLEKLYLNLSNDGAMFQFTESVLDTGVVDIRQLK